jgi:hypothetical protein
MTHDDKGVILYEVIIFPTIASDAIHNSGVDLSISCGNAVVVSDASQFSSGGGVAAQGFLPHHAFNLTRESSSHSIRLILASLLEQRPLGSRRLCF